MSEMWLLGKRETDGPESTNEGSGAALYQEGYRKLIENTHTQKQKHLPLSWNVLKRWWPIVKASDTDMSWKMVWPNDGPMWKSCLKTPVLRQHFHVRLALLSTLWLQAWGADGQTQPSVAWFAHGLIKRVWLGDVGEILAIRKTRDNKAGPAYVFKYNT